MGSESGGNGRGPVGRSETQVLGVEDGLVQEARHVVVVEGVGGAAPDSVPGYETERPQESQLVGDRLCVST
jgi:hypothetical protein